ncbi:kynureninase [Amycolatopsis magusensis]|uniref:kynureninase n=1 Tax=Amycolatopsis magusensis TaxID=882444 RepID=UPI0024A7FB7A|nr:aminotransferase class V-fold PLP-dependent enzyme [Amycolatopsis magusensis]MDI5977374.1 aminotransferase class V-fold PLP-dependent enzyme [Amycolatopsis magusensis]
MTLQRARELDETDPLYAFRDRFLPADEKMVAYLDGNSLGRPPRAALERLETLVRENWGGRLIRGWADGWIELPTRLGDRLGEVVLGAAPGQVVLGESTSVWLYKLLRAALALRPGRREIVTDRHNFPTDRYLVEGIAEELGCRIRWVETELDTGPTVEQVAALVGPETAVVTLSQVDYWSAHVSDLPAITRLVHEAGALVVWDLCHSAGSIPLSLDADEVDFAVGCTYKFLCGGPGSPAFAYVRRDLVDEVRQPIWGWFGRRDLFEMGPGYEPADGVRRLLSGTPPVVGLAGVEAGVELIAEAGMPGIRAKAVALTEFAVQLFDDHLSPLGFELGSPRDPDLRGGHVTIRRADARELSAALIEAGVLVDFRAPDGIRLGLSPLTTGFEELYRAMEVIRDRAR